MHYNLDNFIGYHDVTNVEIVGCPRAATRCTLDRGGEHILNITYDSGKQVHFIYQVKNKLPIYNFALQSF